MEMMGRLCEVRWFGLDEREEEGRREELLLLLVRGGVGARSTCCPSCTTLHPPDSSILSPSPFSTCTIPSFACSAQNNLVLPPG